MFDILQYGDGIDTKTSSGLNFMTFKLSFNDYYSQDISNKIRAVKYRKQEKGEYMATYAPFGYKKDPDPNNKNHLLINEKTAPIVRKIYNLYLQGYGTPKITDMLNNEKIPSPSQYLDNTRYNKCSHKWTKSTVYRILKSRVYIGSVEGHKSVKVNHKIKTRIKVPKEEWYRVQNKHDPIIDIVTFEEVQRKIVMGNQSRDRKNLNPIKQFVYCGKCGAKASLKTHKRQVKSGEIHTHQYFICGRKSQNYHNCNNGRIASSILNSIVKEQIQKECAKVVFSKGDITSLYKQAMQSSNNKRNILKKNIEKLENDLAEIERKTEQIYNDKLEGVIKQEDFLKFYNSLQEKKEKQIIKINELKKEYEKSTREKVIDYEKIKKTSEEWLNLDDLENKELLGKLIDRIEYQKGKKIKIKFKFMENK